MKTSVWNVKEILNVPSVGKKSGKRCATSDYTSITDSQFLFGSQFWPGSSQGLSQEMTFSGPSRGSQHPSQEINELKMSTNYQFKPLPFGDGKATNFSGSNAVGILDRFEEEKRRAKESEILTHGLQQLHDSLDNVKRAVVSSFDISSDNTRNAVSEGIDRFRKTIQDELASIKAIIVSQTEVLKTLVNQTHTEIKDTEAKTTLALKEMGSFLPKLQQDLELLRAEQSKEQSMQAEILTLLSKLMATYSTETHSSPAKVTVSTLQRSPSLMERFCVVSEEKQYCEGMRLCRGAIVQIDKREDHGVCPVKVRSPDMFSAGASFQVQDSLPVDKQQQQPFNNTAAEMTEPSVRQKPYCTGSVLEGAERPVAPISVTGDIQGLRRSFVVAAPKHDTQVISWNGMDENNLTTRNNMPSQKIVSKRGQRNQVFRRRKRALILPQRRSANSMASVNLYKETENKQQEKKTTNKGVSEHQYTKGLTNRSEYAQQLNPWSQPQCSSSSQMIVEYQKTVWETPEFKTSGIKTQRGNWQLFDFINDSD